MMFRHCEHSEAIQAVVLGTSCGGGRVSGGSGLPRAMPSQ